MRKLLLTALAALMMTACGNKHSFTVEGQITGAEDSVLYLHHMSLTGATLLDSVKLDGDGQFRFEEEAPEAPDFYVLRIDNQIVNFSIDSTETVNVKASYPGMAVNYEIEGSDNCLKIRELAHKQQRLQQQLAEVDRNLALGRERAIDSMQTLINIYKEDVTNNYIFMEPNKAYAYFALFQSVGPWNIFDKNDARDLRVFGAVATSWETYYPGSQRTENLHNITLKSMNDNRQARALQQKSQLDESIIVESGVIDLQLTDNHGKVRTLTELKGKVVLLDFHSFTLPKSAARILALRELYNKYHDRGLEIYQVCADDEHFWRQMVEALPWISVTDDSGQSFVKYNVQEVPEYFLIDRQNQLQKRSSQIKDLEAEIKAMI